YCVVLGATYGFLGVWVPVKAAVILTNEGPAELIADGPNPYTIDSADINDHLATSSPSGKTVLIIFGGLIGFFVLAVLIVEFRQALGDRKSTRLNSSHDQISYAVFCLKKKKTHSTHDALPLTLQPHHYP